MLNLLKADLFRIVKSKLFVVCVILAVSIPFLIVFMFYGILKVEESVFTDEEAMGMIGTMFNAKYLIASSFSLTDNFGLVLPVFAGVFVSKDLINGTLRNKVIAGHSRTNIYLSHLISSFVFNFFLIVLYAGMTSTLALMLFKYGPEFNAEEAKNLIFLLVLGIVSFLFVATVSTFFGLMFSSLGPTIVLTVTFCLVMSLFSSIISLTNYEKFKYLVYFIPLFFNGTTLTIGGVDTTIFIEGLASCFFFGALNCSLGVLLFNRKDLK